MKAASGSSSASLSNNAREHIEVNKRVRFSLIVHVLLSGPSGIGDVIRGGL